MKKYFIVMCMMLTSSLHAFDFSNMESNRWYEVIPTFNYQGRSGNYQQRNWCTLRYNPDHQSILFYEGFTSGEYCIYANALYEYYPASTNNVVDLLSVADWSCNGGGTAPPMIDNSGGQHPRPRHTYSQFAYAPSTESVYLISGSMGVGNDGHFLDFWQFSNANLSWNLLGFTPFIDDTPPMEAPPEYFSAPVSPPSWLTRKENIFDQNLLFYPPTNELFFFYTMTLYYKPGPGWPAWDPGRNQSQAIYAYNLNTHTWRVVFEVVDGRNPNPIPPWLGSHATYDNQTDRFVFYSSSEDRNLYAFSPSDGTWTILQNNGSVSPSPREFGCLEYISSHNVFVYGGQTRDIWIYDPIALQWTDITPNPLPPAWPPGSGSYNWVFDPAHDVLIHFNSSTGHFWLYRYCPDNPEISLPKILLEIKAQKKTQNSTVDETLKGYYS